MVVAVNCVALPKPSHESSEIPVPVVVASPRTVKFQPTMVPADVHVFAIVAVLSPPASCGELPSI